MKVDIDSFESNFAESAILIVNMVDVQTRVANETTTKETIIEPLAKSDNLVRKEKLNGEPRTMPVNMVNMSQKVRTEFDSKYEMIVFENEQKSVYPKAGEDLLNFLIR